MKTLLDTSVLVAALVEPHPDHERALPWLTKAKSEAGDLVISSHTIAELYAVLSTLPVSPRITPGLAWRLIRESVEPHVSMVSLTSSEYVSVVKYLSDMEIAGGAVYDALIVKAGQKSGADRIVTLNVNDFGASGPKGQIASSHLDTVKTGSGPHSSARNVPDRHPAPTDCAAFFMVNSESV